MAISKFKTYKLSGNTFAAKEQIKKIGGKWDKPGEFWIVQVGGMGDIGAKKYPLQQIEKMGVKIEQI